MRKTVVVFFSIVVAAVGLAFAQRSSLEIPPRSSLELDYADYEMYQLKLRNNGRDIDVKVVDKKTGEFIRGFGLGPVGKVEVMVENTSKIVFVNSSDKTASLSVSFTEMDAKKVMASNEGLVSFTLVNSSSKSIPLIIPNEMNPNLSPKSNSGVD